jgi:protein-disulfide isomerase-like protein with CxxC motif
MANLKPIGATQRSVLEGLLEHSGWHPGCGWCWSNYSTQMRIVKALVKRGLVKVVLHRSSMPNASHIHYDITEAGRQEVFAHSAYYKLKFGGKKHEKNNQDPRG